jgi:radical SAM protein with 4Fe4S-binding SPASM domain
MNVDQLTNLLTDKYSVIDIIDLAELSRSHQAAYKFFYKIYQTEYALTDRIVLYTSQEISDQFLQHLYQAANFVDISNYFILICTTTDISQRLEDLASLYSSDPVPFKNFKIDIEPTVSIEDNYHLPDSICAVPWTHLEIMNDGAITPCCKSNGLVVGNINKDSLDMAFHSKAMQDLRNQFLAGQKPRACASCWETESRGLSSIRIHNIKRLKKQFLTKYLDQPTITSLDIKFNNTCNFKCRICSPESSSLIAAEQRKFLNLSIAPQSNWAESENFVDQITEKLPELTNIDMYGGEPFLIKKFVNVLRTAVEQGHAKNIRLHYNSNGSVWPEAFVDYWPYFREVDIHFSIDAIGPRFELQRGGSWAEVEQNILKIKNLNLPNMTFSLMPTISILSVYYLDEVYDWAQKHNFGLYISNLLTPNEFSLKNLTKPAQDLIIEKFKDHPWTEIQNILNFIKVSAPSDGHAFAQKIKWFDSIRNENFADHHSEIAEAMGYMYNKTL